MTYLVLEPRHERALVEVCASIHHQLTVDGNKEVPRYTENQLNFDFRLPEDTHYQFRYENKILILESDHHRLEFEYGKRKLKLYSK